jgi:3-hydroxyacyl-CoA dehydrogenase
MSRFQVKKVAVLGAGVMGAQIAAHLVNVKVPVILFDLPPRKARRTASSSRRLKASRSSSRPRWACLKTRR